MKAIVVMAREPKPYSVKTRLTPPLDPSDTSRIYESFLLDKIQQVKCLEDVDRFVAFTPETSRDYFESIIPSGFKLISQVGEDLGERLANISKALFEKGYDGVVMIDSDTPNLPSSHIISGLDALRENDVVVGPCEDGGYYLIGLSSELPTLFEDIPWSTSDVVKTTMKKAKSMGNKPFLLEKWYDIDTFEDLRRLKIELDTEYDASNQVSHCRNTYKILSEILKD